jgi:hypothetical protein
MDSYAKVEIMGHHVAIGRVSEVLRFGAVFCQVEAIDEEGALGRPVLHGGAAIFRLTPLSREEAIELVKNPYMTVKVLPQRASDVSSYDPYEDYDDPDDDDCDPNDNEPEDIQPLGVDAIRVKPITTLPNATEAAREMYDAITTLPNATEVFGEMLGESEAAPSEFKRIGEAVHAAVDFASVITVAPARFGLSDPSALPNLNTVDGRREAAESPAPEWELVGSWTMKDEEG